MPLSRLKANRMSQIFFMLRNMGYEKYLSYSIREDHECAWEAIKKSCLPIDLKSFRAIDKPIHEVEHLVMNKNFSLYEEGKQSYSLFESVVEEFFINFLREENPKFLHKDNIESVALIFQILWSELIFKENECIQDALNRLASESFTTTARNKVKNSIIYDLKSSFKDRLDLKIDSQKVRVEFIQSLINSCIHLFSFDKGLIEEENALMWRRFALQMKLEVLKKSKRKGNDQKSI